MKIFKVAMQKLVDAWQMSANKISLGFEMALVSDSPAQQRKECTMAALNK
jgi:hypothetical protein